MNTLCSRDMSSRIASVCVPDYISHGSAYNIEKAEQQHTMACMHRRVIVRDCASSETARGANMTPRRAMSRVQTSKLTTRLVSIIFAC